MQYTKVTGAFPAINIVIWCYGARLNSLSFTTKKKKSTIFAAPIFTKLAKTQQHYVHIYYIDFHPYRTKMFKVQPEIHLLPKLKYGVPLRRFLQNSSLRNAPRAVLH